MVASQMFLGTAATLIASSTAFVAPMAVRSVATTPSSSSLKMSAGSDYVATLPGAPFSDGKIFDPLGLSDGAAPGDIKQWREAEIKHGRVAMLASLGVIVAEQYHPFFMGPDYIGPAVDHFQEISAQFPEYSSIVPHGTTWLLCCQRCHPSLDTVWSTSDVCSHNHPLSVFLFLGVLPPGHGLHRVQHHHDRLRHPQRCHRRGRPEGGLHPGRPRLRPPQPQARRRGGSGRDEDQGAEQRSFGHDRHRRHVGAGAGQPGRHPRLDCFTSSVGENVGIYVYIFR
ncbi:unnamed protein product [Ectocarpus sp. 4 AP-2014]